MFWQLCWLKLCAVIPYLNKLRNKSIPCFDGTCVTIDEALTSANSELSIESHAIRQHTHTQHCNARELLQ